MQRMCTYTCSRRVCFKIFRFNWHVKTSTKQRRVFIYILSSLGGALCFTIWNLKIFEHNCAAHSRGKIIHTCWVVMHLTDCMYTLERVCVCRRE